MRSTKAIIDLSAIQHNLQVVRQLAPNCQIMAVVKADAYGHGIERTAKSLQMADAIAVACMDEAVSLRSAGVEKPIVLLEGFFSASELQQAIELNLQSVVHQMSQAEQILAAAKSGATQRKLTVWLKMDSGMNRLGFYPPELHQVYELLQACPLVEQINLMSHLACADDIRSSMNLQQISLFKKEIADYPGEKSMANSAGVIAWPESHFDWIRPGIMLYGCSPMLEMTGEQHLLKPAMSLVSQLFAIHELKPGDKVGYGATWTATRHTRIGVIAIGYGDGYPRHAVEGTPVLINGHIYPLVGKVSMDMITVDLGTEDNLTLGDRAVLWGDGLPVETIAKYANTIPYTLLCGVTSRVKFEWRE